MSVYTYVYLICQYSITFHFYLFCLTEWSADIDRYRQSYTNTVDCSSRTQHEIRWNLSVFSKLTRHIKLLGSSLDQIGYHCWLQCWIHSNPWKYTLQGCIRLLSSCACVGWIWIGIWTQISRCLCLCTQKGNTSEHVIQTATGKYQRMQNIQYYLATNRCSSAWNSYTFNKQSGKSYRIPCLVSTQNIFTCLSFISSPIR